MTNEEEFAIYAHNYLDDEHDIGVAKHAFLAAKNGGIQFERCEQAPKCLCFDKAGRQICGCYIKHTGRALKKMEAATELRRAKLRVKLGPGVCLECEGDGKQGGQFCGGYWTCEACGGTGMVKA